MRHKLLAATAVTVGAVAGSYYVQQADGFHQTAPEPDWARVTLTNYQAACLTPRVDGELQDDSSRVPRGKYPPLVGELFKLVDRVGAPSSYTALVDGRPVQLDCATPPPAGVPGSGGMEVDR